MNMNTSKVLLDLKFDRKRSRVKTCPCGKSNRDGKFTPYVGHDDKGYCHSCEKTFLPESEKEITPFVLKAEPSTSYISFEIFKASLSGYDNNVFVQFLHETFGTDRTNEIVTKYFIGSTKTSACIFWQIDSHGRIRSGKVMQYDSSGHRLKHVSPVWAHTKLSLNAYNLKQCLFGAHLLKGNSKPVAVVESEKTACIASLYFPEFLWLACGGKDGLKSDKMTVLKGHRVILFPDVQGFEQWTARATELAPMLDIKVSDLLERKATEEERTGKLDLADYLLRFKVEDFVKPSGPYYETFLEEEILMHPAGFPMSWDIPMQPRSMAMISVDDYRNNGWRLPKNYEEIQNAKLVKHGTSS